MRRLTNEEYLDFKTYVKCDFLNCVHGLGLAGRGACHGKWDTKDCADFEVEFEKQFKKTKKSYSREKEVLETAQKLIELLQNGKI